MSNEGDKTLVSNDSKHIAPYKVSSLEVQKSITFDSGRTHTNVQYKLVIDIDGEKNLDQARWDAERQINTWLKETREDMHRSDMEFGQAKTKLSFNANDLNWKYSNGTRKPLELIPIEDEKTRELANEIKERGIKELDGYSYWIFKDNSTIGRRRIE